ncbi:hypothetical protein MO973_16370 [Paenibacillus sp. TRM 82003]|uniref:hypothetical protein n=1 Tax=Kineococcus sp. TRM81007 TaxID=2925831 RepID=UPI001F5ADA03|nr:hypothetical protein [Kineococcus sp. TRM81007]MCI2237787.1 hypothetical protein [Kineococcus sp. TRM81007]MCI3921807.1 hypothetical protein [Paenibacillus sp. TRM 82003]
MSGAGTYAVEHGDLPQQDLQALDRSVLAHLAPRAATVETDLPVHEPGTWPAEVEAAAEQLRRHSDPGADPGTDPERYCYAVADVRTHPHLWDAFVLVAPHAYDAEVRDAHGTQIASLSDEGTLVLHLDDEQHQRLAALIGVHRLRLLDLSARRRWWVPWRRTDS